VAAVIVRDDYDAAARRELAALRDALGRGPRQPLHFWKFSHPQRLHAAQATANLPIRAITSVILCKEPLRDSKKTRLINADPMYLWALRLLIERVSWCIRRSGGSGAKATFAEVKGFKSGKLHDYRRRLESRTDVNIDWALFKGHPFRVDRPATMEMLQVADTAASAIFQAVEPDPFGNTEPRYLKELKAKIFCPSGRLITSYGLKTFPTKVSKPGGPLEFLRGF
jgi:hypothetical protein